MDWIKITESTELPKEQQVVVADKMDTSFSTYDIGERPFDSPPHEIRFNSGAVDTIHNYTHYAVITLPND